MTGKRVTMKDIARELSVSVPTVSRALADHPDIREETKARVREVAEALRYIPNYRARYLRARHSRLIALIVPEMNMFFVPSLIAGINRVVQHNDYSLIVFQSDNSLVQERRLIEECTHLSADGVLIALSSETRDLEHLRILDDTETPVVLLDKTLETDRRSMVTIDDESAGASVARYLAEHGHADIVGVFGDQRHRISRLRCRGFLRGCEQAGLPPDSLTTLDVSLLPRLDSQLEVVVGDDVTAVFAMSDELLVRVHHHLVRRGLRIPEDISLIAISDGEAPYFLHPNVTHLRHAGGEVGERSAHILIGLIQHGAATNLDVRIGTRLVELGSVAQRD